MGHVFFYPAVSEVRRHGGSEAHPDDPDRTSRGPLAVRVVRAEVAPATPRFGSARAR
jgi:hypothetical protein